MKMASGRSNLLTPDNNIWFIDNENIVRNPRPERTPPPPIWGEEEEVDEHVPGEAFVNPSAHKRDWSFLDAKSTRKKITKEIDEMYDESQGGNAAVASAQSKTILVRTSEGRQSQVGVRNEGGKSRKLKKKVVYVYESDSGSEGEKRQP